MSGGFDGYDYSTQQPPRLERIKQVMAGQQADFVSLIVVLFSLLCFATFRDFANDEIVMIKNTKVMVYNIFLSFMNLSLLFCV